jgi:hypothetical protein
VVSDPKAFNNIVIKDQTIFEETRAFLTYVLLLLIRLPTRHPPISVNREVFGPGLLSTLGTHLYISQSDVRANGSYHTLR